MTRRPHVLLSEDIRLGSTIRKSLRGSLGGSSWGEGAWSMGCAFAPLVDAGRQQGSTADPFIEDLVHCVAYRRDFHVTLGEELLDSPSLTFGSIDLKRGENDDLWLIKLAFRGTNNIVTSRLRL